MLQLGTEACLPKDGEDIAQTDSVFSAWGRAPLGLAGPYLVPEVD